MPSSRGCKYADPATGLASIAPPEAGSTGEATLSYPLVLPEGRGITPGLALTYRSGATSSWVGYGWDLSVGDVSVDTTFGVPLFCPRGDEPTCGNYESESYRLDGELLAPTARRTDLEPRVAERSDFTRVAETTYDHIVRHGTSPSNYFWEVRDKEGNVSWYGGHPDAGGPFGGPGTRTTAGDTEANDGGIAREAILADQDHNGVRWYLSAYRDAGVNLVRYDYETVYVKATTGPDGGIAGTPPSDLLRPLRQARLPQEDPLHRRRRGQRPAREDPSYEVVFHRDRQRTDPVIDARGGVLDVDLDQLDVDRGAVDRDGLREHREGRHLRPPDPGRRLRQDAARRRGPDGVRHRHRLLPSDAGQPHLRVLRRGGEGSGFSEPVDWDTRNDHLTSPVEQKVGALGMSERDGGDGHVYIGFNPTLPDKLGSFGGSLSFDGATTRSKVEFLDINGDRLPDKVYLDGTGVHYRLNNSDPAAPLTSKVTFERRHSSGYVEGLDLAPRRACSRRRAAGVEAFFGVLGDVQRGRLVELVGGLLRRRQRRRAPGLGQQREGQVQPPGV